MAKMNWGRVRSENRATKYGIEIDDTAHSILRAKKPKKTAITQAPLKKRSLKKPTQKKQQPGKTKLKPAKFKGTIEELKALVKDAGISGNWRPDGQGKYTFRSPEGGILNWWTNGTVNFQGQDYGRSILERSLTKIFS